MGVRVLVVVKGGSSLMGWKEIGRLYCVAFLRVLDIE